MGLFYCKLLRWRHSIKFCVKVISRWTRKQRKEIDLSEQITGWDSGMAKVSHHEPTLPFGTRFFRSTAITDGCSTIKAPAQYLNRYFAGGFSLILYLCTISYEIHKPGNHLFRSCSAGFPKLLDGNGRNTVSERRRFREIQAKTKA